MKMITILKNKLEIIEKLNKSHTDEYMLKAKRLHQISLSFSIIMLMHKNVDYFHQHLEIALDVLRKAMVAQPYSFDTDCKSQVLSLLLLSYLYLQNRFKLALRCIKSAHKITSKLD